MKTLAQTISAQFNRIQFTPDLLPSDLIGTMIFNQQTHEFYANLVDAISTFFVLIPELRGLLKVKSYSDLDMTVAAKIVNAYLNDYYPFYKEVMKEVYGFQNETPASETKKKSESEGPASEKKLMVVLCVCVFVWVW